MGRDRWSAGNPEVRRGLARQKGQKGGVHHYRKFSDDAKDYVRVIDPKVILIDGRDLAEYMIDYNLGISTTITYDIKGVDSDYFAED